MKWLPIIALSLVLGFSTIACKNDKQSSTVTPAEEKQVGNPNPKNTPETSIPPINKTLKSYTPIHEIDAIGFQNKINEKNTVLIDIRTPGEVKKGSIDGATNIDILSQDANKEFKALDKGTTYLLFGATGIRSLKAAHTMAEMGFSSIYSLEGGLGAWDKLNKESEKK